VAQALAERLGGAILSADSMLVYRGMDIGTAKPDAASRARVRYGGLDLVDPDADFSVWDFRAAAAVFLRQCRAEGRPVIVVGGSGLYVKSLTHGLDALPKSDPDLRARWEAVHRERGGEPLREELRRLDPLGYAAVADLANPRRLLRAIEVAAAGATLASRQASHAPATAPLTGIAVAPALLRTRIAERVRRMWQQGLVEEVRGLLTRWPALSRTAGQAIGYAEVSDLLAGRCARADAETRMLLRTARLAKKQRTWFRHQAHVEWVELDADRSIEDTATLVQEQWTRHGPVDIAAFD
jgi:tRNA dimethylallyltransferase